MDPKATRGDLRGQCPRAMKAAVIALSIALVVSALLNGLQLRRNDALTDELAKERAERAAAKQAAEDSVFVWRLRTARALHTADSAMAAGQRVDSVIVKTQAHYRELRQSIPGADAARIDSIIRWRSIR